MRKRILACSGLLCLLVLIGVAEQAVPVAVSPGRAKGVAVVGELRPTFSWTSVDWAVGYRIAIFEALGVAPVSYEQMAASGTTPVLTKEIEGRGLSWTPSTEESLPGGGMYVWYVEAMSPSGPGVWSSGRVFIVSAAVGDAATEERVTKVLRENGVRDEVITSVVREMKAGDTGARTSRVETKPLDSFRPTGTEGETNTFYGIDAGKYTTGHDNSFFGRSAGASTTIAAYNTFLGGWTGYSNITGEDNTFIGMEAGFSNTGGNDNIFVGKKAGYYTTTGSSNIFIGHEAGKTNSTGDNNVFIGHSAGIQNTEGRENTFLGYSSGYYNTTGRSNIFVGYLAGNSNTTGYENTFLGRTAGRSNTTGIRNTFLGISAGSLNTLGNDNTFLGADAGYSNTAGSLNTFIGRQAGYANTTENYNTFVGSYAGRNNAGGTFNAFLGQDAGNHNTSGANNTLIGFCAGYTNTTGNENTFLGKNAGFSNSVGTGNVFLGYSAGYNETGSNKLYIANSNTNSPLIYGDFSSGILAVNGLFAIGTKTPTYPMELKTTGRNATFILQRSDGGALNFMNATSSYGQFGTGNNYPVRIQVNNAWKMQLDADGSLTMANGATCTAGGVWTNASSRELKENVADLTAEQAEAALAGLSPVTYNYKADKAENHVGFIAEDVPDLVASKDRKTLSPMDVVAVLTQVVKEQQKMISDQQKTIADLKERMAKIESKGNQEKSD